MENKEKTIFTVIVIILSGVLLYNFLSWPIVLVDVNKVVISVQILLLQNSYKH